MHLCFFFSPPLSEIFKIVVECYLQSDPKAVVGSFGDITRSAGFNKRTKKTHLFLQDTEQKQITLAFYLLLSTQILNSSSASISR